jgi:outer membrane protein insertion porin family
MKFTLTGALARKLLVVLALGISAAPALFYPVPSVAQSAFSFSSIRVEGNRRIDSETIRVIAAIPTGRSVSASEVDAGLDRLVATGLFADVQLRPAGGVLVIEVVENPTINRVNFEGNSRIADDVLAGSIALQPRAAFSPEAAEVDAQTITEIYRTEGRFNATVRPVIIEQTDNRVDLVFEITEGSATGVSRINFVGNQRYSDSRLLRTIETTESGLLSFLFTSDSFDRDRMIRDEAALTDFYHERGYADFEVRSSLAELDRSRDNFFITYSMTEGPQYHFGRVTLSSSIVGLSPEGFTGQNFVKSGRLYSRKALERAVEVLEDEATLRKIPFVSVRPVLVRNDVNQTIDVEFVLEQGERVFIERIDITGNSTTLDRVIRRQFRLAEGDPLNPREIRAAEDRIRGLRYFSDVRVGVHQGSSPNQAVVAVNAQDTSTGNLSFGVNFASDNGFSGSIAVNERNFLGRGQELNFELGISESSNTLIFSFTEPALLDRDLLAGFDLYYRAEERDESSFQTTNIGFEPRVAFPLSEHGRLEVRYRLSSDEIRDFGPDASPIIVGEAGTLLTSAIGFTYSYDRRDSVTDPSRGFIFSLSQDFAGLGGDAQYSKTTARVRAFTSLLDEDVIVSGELEAGALTAFSGGSRITDRFFLGGDSFRGFAYGGIGPRDSAGDVNDALGGNMFAMARLQASFPLGFPPQYGIYGGVFLDAGTLWDLDVVTGGASGTIDDAAHLRAAAGVSLFWETPIGPLRFNFSRPLVSQPGDVAENFRFTIGTRF